MNMIVIIGALELGGIFAIMSLGLYLSYKILNLPDLTVDGSFTLGCAVSAVLTLFWVILTWHYVQLLLQECWLVL